MATVEDNIATLTQRMINDANAEAEKVLAAARVKADEIRKRGQAQAEAECRSVLAAAQQERERLRDQAVASVQLKARNDQLEFRERLLDQVFVDAREKISTIQQWNNYDEIAVSLLKEALARLKGYPVRVRVDPVIMKLISQEQLEKIAQEAQTQVTEVIELSQGTGVIVETADGHLNYDNTLETRLSRLQNTLRAPVYHILVGEQV